MAVTKETYQAYFTILKEELVPALGCTEPIAIAYASAKAREILGNFQRRLLLNVVGILSKMLDQLSYQIPEI